MKFEGLTILTVAGAEGHWVGYEIVLNKHGEEVRVERWARDCKECGVDFESTQKLPRKLAIQFAGALKRAARKRGPVEVIKHLDRRYGTLENVRCVRCRPARKTEQLEDLCPPLPALVEDDLV